MSGVFGSFLEELEARSAIEDSLKRFARAVDRQDWKLARELYHEDAFDDHGFFKGPPDAFLAHIARLHEQPTALVMNERGWLSWVLLALAASAAGWSVRDLVGWRRLRRSS